jgi:hypothetical protein
LVKTDPGQSKLDVRTLPENEREAAFEAALSGDIGELVGREPHEQRLPFNYATAYRLMAIAADQRIVSHVKQLPPAWGTLTASPSSTTRSLPSVDKAFSVLDDAPT